MPRWLLALALLCGGCHQLAEYERAIPADSAPPPVEASVQPDATVDQGLPAKDASIDAPSENDLGQDQMVPPDSTVDLPPVPGTWVTISAGSFTMGSPSNALCLHLVQYPLSETQHPVTLTRAFEMQTTEVTQGQYEALIGDNPSDWQICGASCPIDKVSWHDAAYYCNQLSDLQGHSRCYLCFDFGAGPSCETSPSYAGEAIYDCPGFRLPTDAEWEYAYRAGTSTAFYSGDITSCAVDANAAAIAWYAPDNKPHPVAQKQANAWGLYDMAGNLWEWCHDWGKENLGTGLATDPVVTQAEGTGNHVLRGGSWNTGAWELRAARRVFMNPTEVGGIRGFRCVRSRPPANP